MFCFGYRKLLIPYSEGELGSGAARKVERHLAKCIRCRTELDGIRMISGALAGSDAPAAEPADDLWARVSARIADGPPEPAPRSAFASTRGLAAGIAAAVIVGVIGMKLLAPPSAPPATTADLYAQRADQREVRQSAKSDQPKPLQPAAKQKAKPAPPPPSRIQTPRPTRIQPRTRYWFAVSPRGRSAGKPAKGEVVALGYGASTNAKADEPDKTWVYYDRGDRAGAKAVSMASAATPSRPAASPAPAASAEALRGGYGVTVNRMAAGLTDRVDGPDASYDDTLATTTAAPTTSVVDDLSETEGVRTAAIFAYP